jgi:hypothetical protein
MMKQPNLSLKNNVNCYLATFRSALLLVFLIAAAHLPTFAAPGDLVADVPLPVAGNGVSVAVDCDGVIYYTTGPIGADVPALATLHKTDSSGANLGSVPIVDGGGNPVQIDEMAWDDGRKVLWGLQHNSHPLRVWRVDPTTGLATFAFTSTSDTPGAIYSDGISYEANDDTLWISADVSDTVEHYQACDGTFIGSITPRDAAGNTLGSISGVQVGVGNLLYLGRNGAVEIVQVRKSDGGFLGVFANPAGVRDEGLECDAVSFAPKLVIWSRDFEQSRIIAVEVEPGTCACQALCPKDIVVCNDPGQCGAIVSYMTEATNTVCVPASGSFFPVGQTVVTCTRTHPCPDVEPQTCTFTVTVNDCEPPTISCPAPITKCNDPNQCGAIVTFTAPATDNCPGVTVVCSPPSGTFFPVGTTTVNCTATDAAGNTSTCMFTVTVNDCQAPTVTCSVSVSVLWPPNHNLINVGLAATATDNCPGALTIQVMVFGDEDDEELTGDGNHSPDAKNIAVNTLRLRSERKGDGDGRVYLIVIKATDVAGNVGFCCSTVVVPHDQSEASFASVQAQAAAAHAFCQANAGTPPPGYFVIGDGPIIGPKQ